MSTTANTTHQHLETIGRHKITARRSAPRVVEVRPAHGILERRTDALIVVLQPMSSYFSTENGDWSILPRRSGFDRNRPIADTRTTTRT